METSAATEDSPLNRIHGSTKIISLMRPVLFTKQKAGLMDFNVQRCPTAVAVNQISRVLCQTNTISTKLKNLGQLLVNTK